MSILQALIIGIVQGFTEFVPVSSSGHLLLVQKVMGIAGTGFTFDVALHLGTLMALLIFFYRDILTLVKALFVKTKQTHLAWLLIIATIPAAVLGYLLESAAESRFRSATLVALNLAFFAGIMLFADYYSRRYKKPTQLENISKKEALTMGFAQAAAIVPGVSRSGATITAGILTGLDRVAATRFSFLLGIPITAGAILKVLLKQSAFAQIHQELAIFMVGVIAAFVTGSIAIKFMLSYLSKHGLALFAYYRIGLAVIVLLLMAVR